MSLPLKINFFKAQIFQGGKNGIEWNMNIIKYLDTYHTLFLTFLL